MNTELARAQALLNQKVPQTDQAIRTLTRLIKRKQTSWLTYHYLGVAQLQKEEWEKGAKYLKKSLEKGSTEPETFHLLSVAHYNLGKFEEAEVYAKQAIEKKNDFFEAWLNLGSVYRAEAKLEDALKCYQKANQLDPRSAGVAFRIAAIYKDQGDLQKALELFDIALKIDPVYLEAHAEKAVILQKQKRFEEAKESLQAMLDHQPNHLGAQVGMAEVSKSQGRYEDAFKLYDNILQQFPNVAAVKVNYALCLQEMGMFDESEKYYLAAVKKQPDLIEAFSNYLMGLHYNPKRTKEEIFKAHLRWDEQFAEKNPEKRPVPGNRNPDKKLRIGLISGGFRQHPVGWMITKALENLPEEEIEIYCYTTNNIIDKITRRINEHAREWRSVMGYNNDVIAQMIREDEVDILIELSGHSEDNRLQMVTMNPAPIVVKWVGGLFNTSGLESIDYLLSDWYETPEGEEEYYTEKLVRMPDDYICFLAPDYAPEVGPLPAKENGYITFGCFNNPTKVNPELFGYWAEIMNQVPNSRLFLKSKQYDTPMFKDRILGYMEERGIDPERLIFEGESSHDVLLNAYNRVDIALDPWPYSGGLSTCEALWMGAPVITYPGPTFAGRHAATHLANSGCEEYIVGSWDEYVSKAVSMASDISSLAEIRSALRSKLADSPLCDGTRFGANLAVAFREMWKQRVKGYVENLPETEWQDHIVVDPISEEAMQERKALLKSQAETDEAGIGHLITDEVKKAFNVGEYEEMVEEETSVTVTSDTEISYRVPDDPHNLTHYVMVEQEGWYEKELNFVKQYLQRGMTAVDAGACYGVFALPMAREVGAEGKVYAFEPWKESHDLLNQAKNENEYSQLEVIQKALSCFNSEMKFQSEFSPELNNLSEEGSFSVNTITFDSWWISEGGPEIDFIKIDVSGAEYDMLKGAASFLNSESPVIMVATQHNDLNRILSYLGDYGFTICEYVPGLNILAEFEGEMDAFTQNLLAFKEDKAKELREMGWLFNPADELPAPAKDAWKSLFTGISWAESVLSAWEPGINSAESKEYRLALNYLGQARSASPENKSEKATYMLLAAQILIGLYNSGRNNWPVTLTTARVLQTLGKRSQAVEILKGLIETGLSGEIRLEEELPFLLPMPEQDQYPIQTDFRSWLIVRLVEAWVLLKDHSTYFSGPQERKMLLGLKGNPEAGEVINRVLDQLLDEDANIKTPGVQASESQFDGKFIHICFNHVYARALSDLVEHANQNSDQEHWLYIELRRAIADYSADISANPHSTFFDFTIHLETVINRCLEENVDGIFIHGLFFDWQKELINRIGSKKHIGWILWGGDLYNPIKSNNPIHKLAAQIDSIHTLGSTDVDLFEETYGHRPHYAFGYPYPGLYGNQEITVKKSDPPLIIVGNSGDPSNGHLEVLEILAAKKDIHNYQLLLPVSYNFNDGYKNAIQKLVKKLGLEKITRLKEDFIHPDKYAELMQSACMQITAHHRQQAVGNLLMSAFSGNHTIVREHILVDGKEIENPTWDFLTKNGFEITRFEEFKKAGSIAELGSISEEIQQKHAEIISEKFSLDLRSRELTKSCQQILDLKKEAVC